ncbi:MAG: hypothetical protein HY554_16960 [Elusimicrobia bacterium]|nr:hypothetical protein [Elusimicrobiota bacterium]
MLAFGVASIAVIAGGASAENPGSRETSCEADFGRPNLGQIRDVTCVARCPGKEDAAGVLEGTSNEDIRFEGETDGPVATCRWSETDLHRARRGAACPSGGCPSTRGRVSCKVGCVSRSEPAPAAAKPHAQGAAGVPGSPPAVSGANHDALVGKLNALAHALQAHETLLGEASHVGAAWGEPAAQAAAGSRSPGSQAHAPSPETSAAATHPLGQGPSGAGKPAPDMGGGVPAPQACPPGQLDCVAKAAKTEAAFAAYSMAEAAAGWLPYSKALKHYLSMVGLRGYKDPASVGGANEGLNAFYERLARGDPRYAARLRSFYERVQRVTWALQSHERPSLADKSWEGRYERLPPGWAWRTALQVAENDPNLAMRLIGFCGHDDVLQSKLRYRRTPEEARLALEKERLAIQQLSRAAKARVAELEASGPPFDAAASEELSLERSTIESLAWKLAGTNIEDFLETEEDICPGSGSAFYAPGSLDEQADVDARTKTEVGDAQAPGKGAAALPAKHYHVLGGAAMACELIRKGSPPWLAVRLQSAFAWGYRALRTDRYSQMWRASRDDLTRRYEDQKAAGGAPGSLEDFAEKLGAPLATMDAAELMRLRGYGGGDILGRRVPVTNLRVDWPWNYFREVRPRGWSDKRYEAAVRAVKAALVDFEWTTAQHEAGARFAAEHCRAEE